MAVIWEPVTEDVLNVARECIDRWHPSLRDARIGFLFRMPAPKRAERKTLAAIGKVSASLQVYLKFDFILWISKFDWRKLNPAQRLALIDHELCHVGGQDDNNNWVMRDHDITEFVEVVQRHGLWQEGLQRMAEAVQMHLPDTEQQVEDEPEPQGALVGIPAEMLGIAAQAASEA